MATPLLKANLTLSNDATAGAITYTVAQLVGGLITRDTNGAGRTDVTPTAVQLNTVLKREGDTLSCYLIATTSGAEAITLSGGTGVTIANAGQTINQNEAALLLFRRTGTDTVTAYILGA